MFCCACGQKFQDEYQTKFCPNCGTASTTVKAENDGHATRLDARHDHATSSHSSSSHQKGFSPTSPAEQKSDCSMAKPMSFEDYRKSKSKHWKSLVSKGTKKGKMSPQEVTIIISLYEWNDKEDKLKPKRGKRISLKVSPVDPYARILEKAVTKWRDFHSDCFNEEEDYVLLLENGKEALFLPGAKEFFTLKRYREEVGKEFSKIILYLCTRSDFDTSEESRSGYGPCSSTSTVKTGDTFNADGDPEYIWEESDRNDAKRFRQDQERNDTSDESEIMNQIRNDEVVAMELQRTDDIIAQDIQVELKTDSVTEDNNDNKDDDSDSSNFHDVSSLIKSLQTKIDRSGEFFLVVRRGLSVERLLTLWQRESKRNSPDKVLRVKFVGECGIDSGAMSKEFFTKVIQDLGTVMFPDGAPVDSFYNIQNGMFRAVGQILAASLVQGGPPPCFFHENVFKMLLNPNVDIASLNTEDHLTESDKEILTRVKGDVMSHRDMIIEHGYTGKIDVDHSDDIVGTITVNVIGKRLIYLKEIAEGMKLYGLIEVVRSNPSIMQPLFVNGGCKDIVDANYVFSLVRPDYSPDGSTKRTQEEKIVDNLQDFLMSLEDERILGYTEELAWGEVQDDVSSADEDTEKSRTFELTPAGVFGWLTGQQHKPLDDSSMFISVEFDHDCMTRNPDHTICFPTVGSCGRIVTFPVAHSVEGNQFRHMFLLALCKGGAFTKP